MKGLLILIIPRDFNFIGQFNVKNVFFNIIKDLF
jgi:hypothetical protein